MNLKINSNENVNKYKNVNQMKKVCIVIMMLAAIIAAGNAQTDADNSRFFVEGSLNLINQGGTRSLDGVSKEIPSTFAYRFTSIVGYRLNDVFAVGPHIAIETTNYKQMMPDPDNPVNEIEFTSKDFLWTFDVFCRYELVRRGKFSLHIHTQMGIDRGSTKEKTGDTVEKKTKTIKMIGFNNVPFIAYDISDKFSLITAVNFLSFGGSKRTVKYENTGETVKTHYLGFSAQNRVFYIGDVGIGFTYKF